MRTVIEFLIGLRLRQWATAALTVLALVLVYSGIWIYGAAQTVKATERWISDRRAEGYSVRHDGLQATGYPLWIRIDLVDPGFGAPNSPSPWGWQGDRLSLTARPWRPGRLHLATTGAQMVSLTVDGHRLTFAGSLDAAEVEMTFDGGAPERLRVTVAGLDLVAQQDRGGKISVAAATIDLERRADASGDAIALDVTSSRVELPALVASPLGQRVEDLRLAARLLGALPRGPGASLIEALEIWRDGGGTLEVDQIALSHGPLVLRGDGTLALDRDLQPVGAFTARIQGFFETIDALSRLGLIGAGQAVSAKMLLGVFAHRPQNGGPATLNLAVTVQQRALYAGPVKLLELPMLKWQ